jgi:hypothetical protein
MVVGQWRSSSVTTPADRSVVSDTSAPGGNRDVVPTSELEAVGDVAGSAATRVGGGGDADKFDARPAEQHGQGAGVVGVTAEVGVEMDPCQAGMPPVTSCSRS